MKKQPDISPIFAEAFQDFEARPDRDIWASIEAGITPEPAVEDAPEASDEEPARRRTILPWFAGAAAACAMLILGWYMGRQSQPAAPMAHTPPAAEAWQPLWEPLAAAPIQPVAVMHTANVVEAKPVARAVQKAPAPVVAPALSIESEPKAEPEPVRPILVADVAIRTASDLAPAAPMAHEIPMSLQRMPVYAASVAPEGGTHTLLALDEANAAQVGEFLVQKVIKGPNAPIQVETLEEANQRIRRVSFRLPGVQIKRSTHTEILPETTP
ncbi:MAG: hypothetical protein AAFV07_14630 [Bacteroidota bacterium]